MGTSGKPVAEHFHHAHLHDAEVCYCPRCHHQVRFQQAQSDGAWVCQKCCRFRTYTVAAPPEQGDAAASSLG